jgi:hypothetical protein
MQLTPNPLNAYESYSYDIQLAISPENIGKNSGTPLPPGAGVLIAGTGKTANFYVDKVEMKGIPVSAGNNSNTYVVAIDMTIIEPMAFTFFDRYFISVASMGWKQPAEAVLYLTVAFNGWLPDGSPDPKVHKLTWRCTLTTVDVETDFTGSKYHLKLIPLDLMGFNSENINAQRGGRVEIKKKLEDTLKEVANQINKSNTGDQEADNKPKEPYITVNLDVGKFLKELNLEMYVEKQTGTNTTSLAADLKPYFTFKTGQRIEDMLIKLASSAKDIASHLVPNLRGDKTTESTDVPGTQLARWFRITSQLSYGKFDEARNLYKKIITYTIDSHYRPEIELMPPKQEGSKSRAQVYHEKGLLNKRYDYIFTGQNTEVLELKLDFKPLFKQMLLTYTKKATEQTLATDEENRKSEDQDKKSRKVTTKIPESESDSNSASFGGIYMEQYPTFPSLADLLSVNIGPIGSQEVTREGVADLDDKDTNAEKAKIAEQHARAKPSQQLNDYSKLGMITIDMGIRGDPFWLGIDYSDNAKDAEANPNDMGNFPLGTQYFFLKFKMPETYNVSSGLPDSVGRITFTGLYSVVAVTSVFENGKFTQTLRGVYDNPTNGVDLGGSPGGAGAASPAGGSFNTQITGGVGI